MDEDSYDFCAAIDHTRVMMVFGVVAMVIVLLFLWGAYDNSRWCAVRFVNCLEAVNASGMCDYATMEDALYWGWGMCRHLRNASELLPNDTITIPPGYMWRP